MNSKSQKQWREGPTSSIPLMPPHDRPIFCLAVEGDKVVTGSADHGLRQYDLNSTKHLRELFAKKYGHKEWVSTCAYAKGKVMSGGMDSIVCLWDQKGVRCDHFSGHSGSISKVMASDSIGISASYDSSIILWDFKRKKEAQKLYGTHKDAVMDFIWHNSLLISGDKSGNLAIWDLNAGKAIKAIRTHKGSVSNIKLYSNGEDYNVFASTGLNDGTLVVHDMRTHNAIFNQMVHKGAVNSLIIQDDLITTASADHRLEMIHFPSMKKVHSVDTGDMLLCMQRVNKLTVLGTGKGNIMVYDNVSGQCLYGYGVMKKGGCRCIGINQRKDRLVCAGEDENAMVLTF